MITFEASLLWAPELKRRTMKSRPKTKVLVLPVFRRYWLWHAWTDQAAEAAAASKAIPNWREGVGLEEKLQLLGTSLTQRVRLLRSQPRACKGVQRVRPAYGGFKCGLCVCCLWLLQACI